MKNPILNIAMLLCFFIMTSFDGILDNPQQQQPIYTTEKIESYIREVFAEQADVAVLKNDHSKRLVMITDFFKRVQIKSIPGHRDKKITLLSQVKLRETDNPNLKRDKIFDPENFNALKYDFPMSAKKKKLYRVDDTDYLISINPKK